MTDEIRIDFVADLDVVTAGVDQQLSQVGNVLAGVMGATGKKAGKALVGGLEASLKDLRKQFDKLGEGMASSTGRGAKKAREAAAKEFILLTKQLEQLNKQAAKAYAAALQQQTIAARAAAAKDIEQTKTAEAAKREIQRQFERDRAADRRKVRSDVARDERLQEQADRQAASRRAASDRSSDATAAALRRKAALDAANAQAAIARDQARLQARLREEARQQILKDRAAQVRDAKLLADRTAKAQRDAAAQAQAAIRADDRRLASQRQQQSLQNIRKNTSLEIAEERTSQTRRTAVLRAGLDLNNAMWRNFWARHREDQRRESSLMKIREQADADQRTAILKNELQSRRQLESQRISSSISATAGGGVLGAARGRSGLGLALGLGGGGFLAALGLGNTIGIGSEFQTSLNVAQVQLSLTTAEMEKLRKKSLELGNDIKLPGVSAKDAADAMLQLAKAGLNVTDTLAASQAVLQLGRAVNADFADSAFVVGSALNGFGVAAGDASKVADLLAKTVAIAGGTSFNDLRLSIQQSGAVFSSFQKDTLGALGAFEQQNAALSVLSKNLLTGSDAGTSLKTMILSLSSPSAAQRDIQRELADNIGKTSLAYDEATGAALPFVEILRNLRRATENLNQEQRDQVLGDIFGSDAVRAGNILVDNLEQVEKAINDLNGAQRGEGRTGFAEQLAAAQNKGVKGAVDALKSQIETFQILFFEQIQKPVAAFLLGIAKGIDFIANDEAFTAVRRGLVVTAAALGAIIAVKGAAEVLQLTGLAVRYLAASPWRIATAGLLGLTAAFGIALFQLPKFNSAVLGAVNDTLRGLTGHPLPDKIREMFVPKDLQPLRDDPKVKEFLAGLEDEGSNSAFEKRARSIRDGLNSIREAFRSGGEGEVGGQRGQNGGAGNNPFAFLAQAAGAAVTAVITQSDLLRQAITNLLQGDFTDAGGNLADFFGNFAQAVAPFASIIVDTLVGGVRTAFSAISSAITGAAPAALDFIVSVFGTATDMATAFASWVADWGPGAGLTVLQAIGKGLNRTAYFIAQFLTDETTIKAAILGAGGLVAIGVFLGVQIVTGLVQGIYDNRGDIARALVDIGTLAGKLFLKALLEVFITGDNPFLLLGGLILAGLAVSKVLGALGALRAGFAAFKLAAAGNFLGAQQAMQNYQQSLQKVNTGSKLGNIGVQVSNLRTMWANLGNTVGNVATRISNFFTGGAVQPGSPRQGGVRTVNQQQQPARNMAGELALALPAGTGGLEVFNETAARTRTALDNVNTGMAIAAAGVLAYATAQQDGTEKAIGFLGVAGSIAAGFATGGPIGGGLAIGAAVIGTVVGQMKRGEEAAKRVKAATKEWIDVLKSPNINTAALERYIGLLEGDGSDRDQRVVRTIQDLGFAVSGLDDILRGGEEAFRNYEKAVFDAIIAEKGDGVQGVEAARDAIGFLEEERKAALAARDAQLAVAEARRDDVGGAVGSGISNVLDAARQGFGNVLGVVKDNARAQRELNDALKAYQDLVNGLPGTQAELSDALLDTVGVLKEKGPAAFSGDVRAKNEFVLANQRMKDSWDQTVKDIVDKAPSISVASEQIGALRDSLINDLVAAGGVTREEAQKIADDLLKIPTNITITMTVDSAAAELAIRNTTTALSDFTTVLGASSLMMDAKVQAFLEALKAAASANPNIDPVGAAFAFAEASGLVPARNARGSIITRPTLTWVGEGSKAEAIIPLTDPARAVELMRQSGLDKLAAERIDKARLGDSGGSSIPTVSATQRSVRDAPVVGELHVHEVTNDPRVTGQIAANKIAGAVRRVNA